MMGLSAPGNYPLYLNTLCTTNYACVPQCSANGAVLGPYSVITGCSSHSYKQTHPPRANVVGTGEPTARVRRKVGSNTAKVDVLYGQSE